MKRIEVHNDVFEGQNNVYVLDGGDRLVLVDAAIELDDTFDVVSAGVEETGRSVADLDDVFLTHYHEDHVGLAGELQARSGATVHAPAGDDALIGGDEAAWADLRALHRRRFDDWGIPDDEQAELLDTMFTLRMDLDDRPTVEVYEDGDRFDLGDVELTAMALPGHTVGHSGFRLPANDGTELFSGDALLPQYTPNVGGADVRVADSLATYVATLDRLAEAGFSRAWPGHRSPIDDPAGRASEIRDHHLERTERVVEVLDTETPKDPWTIAGELFGSLSGIHILHGPGEAAAHVEHLVDHGVAAPVDGGYVRREAPVDVPSLFE
ncbi:MBL fold metallo-hydrolase [Halobacteriales archaeon Cl-PHB]